MDRRLKGSINSIKSEITRVVKERKVNFIVPISIQENFMEPVEQVELTEDQLVEYVLKLVDKVSEVYEDNMSALFNRINQLVTK